MTMTWAVGRSKIITKTPIDKPLSIPGGKWTTVAETNLPKGKYLVELQVRAPKVSGEAYLGRRGWGTAKGNGIDSTGHNQIRARSKGESWRTPISHVMSGGGPLEWRVWFPGTTTRNIRIVAKVIRLF